MIQNHSESVAGAKLRAESESNPLVGAITAGVEASDLPFEIEASGAGLEVAARGSLPSGLPNRARMKIFSPKPGHTLVFFFKRSLVPFSRDRYSYGGFDLRESSLEPKVVSAWLEFLSSGFHPEMRPENLRRAFPYEIPE